MAMPGVKFDDGSGRFASNCFPVRTLVAQNDEGHGAWLVAQQAEQRRRFKAVICSKPRTYEEIRGERKRSEKDRTAIVPPAAEPRADEDEDDNKILDGFFLMKHCCIEDPTDLCSVNISGQGLSDVKEEDLPLFDNVAYVNASENLLLLESFKSFPIIRELEMSLNGLRGPKIHHTDFQLLEMLDLSYNNLAPSDLLSLGLIPNLKVLHVTGNNLRTLPLDLARPHLDETTFDKVVRFKCLEILMLDDNKLSDGLVFAALAGLRNLKHLNLAKNEFYSVPQLMLVEGKHITQDSDTMKRRRKSGRKSRASARRSNMSSTNKTDRQNSPVKERDKHDNSPKGASGSSVEVGHSEEDGILHTPTEAGIEGTTDAARVPAPHPASGNDLTEDAQGQPMAGTGLGELDTLSELKLEELNLGDFDTTLLESTTSVQAKVSHSGTRVTETGEPAGDAFERPGYTGDVPLPPPFPELRHLNLAHNKIYEEEGLLAVAAWPLLSELVIHDNPLTTQNSGDPPILKRFLTKRLGITILRKRTDPVKKPHIEVPVKPDRKVVMKILPVPRCDVDKLLALEAPKTPSEPHPPPTDRQQPLDPSKPIPPIPSTPVPQEGEEQAGDTFFMTQVDEPAGARRRTPTSRNTARSEQSPQNSSRPRPKAKSKTTNPKYKGYEILLDADPATEEENTVPTDLPSNIRALQYALSHPLVFRDNPTNLQTPQPPYRPYVKGAKMPPSKPRKSKAVKVDEALQHLKQRSTVIENDLKTVLDNTKYNKEYGNDARDLLGQVQRRYNNVRASSMKNKRDADKGHNILSDTLQDVQKQFGHPAKTSV